MKFYAVNMLSMLAVALTLGATMPHDAAAQTAAAQAETPDSLWKAFEVEWKAKAYDRSLKPLEKLLALEKDAVSYELRLRARNHLGDCLVRLDRYADARKAYASFIADEPFVTPRQDWWMAIARTYEKEENWPAAVDALEQILTLPADKVENKAWFTALGMIADFRGRQGDQAAALAAARDCLAVADNKQALNSASSRIKDLLRSQDKNNDRATRFLEFQRLGPSGEDAIKGTPDDLVNPLDALPCAPQPPARLAAFAAIEKTLGFDTSALTQRGLIYALQGRSREACAVLLEACRRAAGSDVASAYNSLVYVGVRGVAGHVADLPDYAVFLRYGPAGSAEAGTLTDPFVALRLPEFKLQPRAAEVTNLRDVVQRLEGIVLDVNWPAEGRRTAATALLRLHSTLGDWGDDRVLTWFSNRLEVEKDARLFPALSQGFFAASRGGRVDWGETEKKLVGVEAFPALQKILPQTTSNPLLTIDKLVESLSGEPKKTIQGQ